MYGNGKGSVTLRKEVFGGMLRMPSGRLAIEQGHWRLRLELAE
jgi:hypothetical protein